MFSTRCVPISAAAWSRARPSETTHSVKPLEEYLKSALNGLQRRSGSFSRKQSTLRPDPPRIQTLLSLFKSYGKELIVELDEDSRSMTFVGRKKLVDRCWGQIKSFRGHAFYMSHLPV